MFEKAENQHGESEHEDTQSKICLAACDKDRDKTEVLKCTGGERHVGDTGSKVEGTFRGVGVKVYKRCTKTRE